MILQTSFRHELVNQKAVVALRAVSNELNQIGMVKLPQVVNLRLRPPTENNGFFLKIIL